MFCVMPSLGVSDGVIVSSIYTCMCSFCHYRNITGHYSRCVSLITNPFVTIVICSYEVNITIPQSG